MQTEKTLFADRRHAGIELAKLLEPKYHGKKLLVLGIPRGGVVVGCEVAKRLNAELSVVITKKLPHPNNRELALGAVAEDGSMFLTSHAQNSDRDSIRNIVASQLREINSRVDRFRKGKPLPQMFNRTVIIVDDGIATGSTIVPAIKLCKSMKASRVIVASPVASRDYVEEVNQLADEVIIALQPHDLVAVSQAYKSFSPMTDEGVVNCLASFLDSKNRL